MSTSPETKPGSALSSSIGRENLTNALTTIGDASFNATVTALDGVPILSAIVSLWRAGNDLKKNLEFRKVVKFLEAVSETSSENRAAFTAKLQDEGKSEEFGENILLLLDRLDDMAKPRIIGRVIAAHIDGHIDAEKAMRLAAIVSRCYAHDLEYLRSFEPGTQGDGSDIAATLYSAGLLSFAGTDYNPDGGIIYELNTYSKLLLKYGL